MCPLLTRVRTASIGHSMLYWTHLECVHASRVRALGAVPPRRPGFPLVAVLCGRVPRRGLGVCEKPWKFSLGRAISTLVGTDPVPRPPSNPLKLRQMIDSIVASR